MNTGPKLAVYGLAVAAMLGVGAAAGKAVGPIHVSSDAPAMDMGSGSHDTSPATLPRRIGPRRGLAVVVPDSTAMPAGEPEGV